MPPRTPLAVCWLAIISPLLGCHAIASAYAGETGNLRDAHGLLKSAPGYEIVQRECTLCHSEKLITQTRASRDGWTETIRWMQETQNLRKFSVHEEKAILDYLTENYAPLSQGRRPPLMIREWYVLEP
ncbi:MAG: hypothetical protein L0Y39_12405 [Methylococcaceae bacterium]|nr:hypothetical protein [Methylococcaceae bacterium]